MKTKTHMATDQSFIAPTMTIYRVLTGSLSLNNNGQYILIVIQMLTVQVDSSVSGKCREKHLI